MTDHLAIVTGATRGIGRAIATAFLANEIPVIATGTDASPDVPNGCEAYGIDFTHSQAVDEFVQFIKDRKPTILINNAGINTIDPFAEVSREDFKTIQRVNLEIPFLLCQAVIPAMKQQGWGRIVNITSIYGVVSKPFRSAYSASKFALDGMTAALAAEVAQAGILANCVAPGYVETALTQRILGQEGMEAIKTQIPIARLAQPEEIAKFVFWLASAENTYISGQNIAIDGGFTRV